MKVVSYGPNVVLQLQCDGTDDENHLLLLFNGPRVNLIKYRVDESDQLVSGGETTQLLYLRIEQREHAHHHR